MSRQNKYILGLCEYDPESRTITSEKLPPRVIGHVQAKLLELLYKNPNIYYSNDDLQKEVWDNRYIENTTIRTTVSYLRKALDESTDCKYIDSGRNKGYRFVAKSEEISNTRQVKKFLPLIIIAVLSSMLLFIVSRTGAPLIIPQVQTTLLGQELDANVDRDLMVFSHKPIGQKYWNLYLKQVGREQYYPLTSGANNDIKAVFSHDGKRIAFNRHDGQSCKIIVAKIDRLNKRLNDAETVFDCPKELLSISIAWKDSGNLYLSYTKSLSSPYQIYLLNITNQQSNQISSSPNSGSGDYYVTKSTESNRVVFFRNIVGSRTEVWLFNENTEQSTKIASFPLVLGAAAWTDNGNKLILRTGNGQLSTLDIDNGESTFLFKANYPVYYPYRINQQAIGFMRGSLRVRDIVRIDRHGNIENVVASSFSDFRPSYANKSGDLAFISNRTGTHQIWLLKKEGELIQLTKFKKSYKITDLAIDDVGHYIAFTIDANLHIMDKKGAYLFSSRDERIYKNPIFSLDGTKLYYSSDSQGKWQIEYQSIKNSTTKKTSIEGYVIKPCSIEDCFYYTKFDDEQLYVSIEGNSEPTNVTLGKIRSPNQISIVNNEIYYAIRSNNKPKIFRQNMTTKQIEEIMVLSNQEFSIKTDSLHFFSSISRESDTNLESIEIH